MPSHGAGGPGHIAFSVDRGALIGWREHFVRQGVAIERDTESNGHGQLYVRDPAGNTVELVEGDIWPR